MLTWLQFKRTFSLPTTLFYYATLGVLIVLLSFAFSNYEKNIVDAGKVTLGVVNLDQHQLAGVLMDSFEDNVNFTTLFNLQFGSEEDLSKAFKTGNVDAYVIIPSGFTEGLLTYTNKPVTLFGHVENPTINRLVTELISGYAHYIDAANAATSSLYFTMEKAGISTNTALKIHNGFSIEMIGATLGRANAFELITYSDLPAVSAAPYFIFAIPLTALAFVAVQSAMQAFDATSFSASQRLASTGVGPFAQVMSMQIAAMGHGLILTAPAIVALFFFMPALNVLRSLLALVVVLWFWQSLWRTMRFVVPDSSALGLLAAAFGFASALAGGGLVPFLMLPTAVKQLGVYSPHFIAQRFAFGGGSHLALYNAQIQWSFIALIALASLFTLLEVIAVKYGLQIKGGPL